MEKIFYAYHKTVLVYLVLCPWFYGLRRWMSSLEGLSLIIKHVSSWGQLMKTIGDAGLNFGIWVDIFTFEYNGFVSLSPTSCFHSIYYMCFTQQITYSCDLFCFSIDRLQPW